MWIVSVWARRRHAHKLRFYDRVKRRAERKGERRRRSGACVRAARHNGGKEQSKPLISRGEVKVASRKHLREAKAARTVGAVRG